MIHTEAIRKDTFHIQLHLTNQCNLFCKHCYEGRKQRKSEWDISELISLLSRLENAFDKWEINGEISLVGGEPTLYPHICEVMDYIHSSKQINRFAILTNGVNIPEFVLETIVKTRPTVQISIDGIDEEKHDYIRGKGNYQKAINTIRHLVSQGVTVFVHYGTSKYTVPVTWTFIQTMSKLGVSQVTFSRDVPIGNSNPSFILNKQELKEVYDTLYSYSQRLVSNAMRINMARPLWACYGESGQCPVGLQTLTILDDGTVYPCRRLPISLGNIKQESIYKIWYESEVLWNLRRRKNIHRCGDCIYLDDCGGARCIAYAITKDYMEADPQCWLI